MNYYNKLPFWLYEGSKANLDLFSVSYSGYQATIWSGSGPKCWSMSGCTFNCVYKSRSGSGTKYKDYRSKTGENNK